MSNIKNVANEVSEVIEVNRAQIEHRASWMGLIYEEMKNQNLDAEGILRKAIRKCGQLHGETFKAACEDPNNCEDFRKAFLGEVGVSTFNMDNIQADKDNVEVDFHYCALVSAWKKLGFDDDTCALLCDIAMDGDRGIADTMGLTLALEETIANSNLACKLHFKK